MCDLRGLFPVLLTVGWGASCGEAGWGGSTETGASRWPGKAGSSVRQAASTRQLVVPSAGRCRQSDGAPLLTVRARWAPVPVVRGL